MVGVVVSFADEVCLREFKGGGRLLCYWLADEDYLRVVVGDDNFWGRGDEGEVCGG